MLFPQRQKYTYPRPLEVRLGPFVITHNDHRAKLLPAPPTFRFRCLKVFIPGQEMLNLSYPQGRLLELLSQWQRLTENSVDRPKQDRKELKSAKSKGTIDQKIAAVFSEWRQGSHL